MINLLNATFVSVLTTIGYIALAIVVLLLMVMIHEFGHYIVGRLLKFKITEFSIGFGKAIFSKVNKRGEKISLRIFPLGGYCAFQGEGDDDEEVKKDKNENNVKSDANIDNESKDTDKVTINYDNIQDNKKNYNPNDDFNKQKPWKRILVYLAGATFNFLSAFIFTIILLCSTGYGNGYVVYNSYVSTQVAPNDIILAINDIDINYVYGNTFETIIGNNNKIVLTISEGEQLKELELTKHYYKVTENKDGVEYTYICYDYGVDVIVDANIAQVTKVYEYTKEDGSLLDIQPQNLVIGTQILQIDKKPIINSSSTTLDELYDDLFSEKAEIKLNIKGKNNVIVAKDYNYVQYKIKVEDTMVDVENTFYRYYNFGLSFNYSHVPMSFGKALKECVPFTFKLGGMIINALWKMLTFQVSVKELGGPITTVSMIAQSASSGLANFLWLLPLLAANLAVFNLLPFPALDGSHVVFTTVEWIRRKPIKRKVENMIHTVGLIALFAFVIVVDIIHLVA